ARLDPGGKQSRCERVKRGETDHRQFIGALAMPKFVAQFANCRERCRRHVPELETGGSQPHRVRSALYQDCACPFLEAPYTPAECGLSDMALGCRSGKILRRRDRQEILKQRQVHGPPPANPPAKLPSTIGRTSAPRRVPRRQTEPRMNRTPPVAAPCMQAPRLAHRAPRGHSQRHTSLSEPPRAGPL